MPLPDFNEVGDLPEGVHGASLAEVVSRFGSIGTRRGIATQTLLEIYRKAESTGKLDRFIIFGSYVSAKEEPNDVDVLLIMKDDFRAKDYDANTRWLFDHEQAHSRLQASVFWTRPGFLILDTIEDLISHWQVKRDKTRRGIVEVIE